MIIYKAISPSNEIYTGITSKSLEVRKKQYFYAANSGSPYKWSTDNG